MRTIKELIEYVNSKDIILWVENANLKYDALNGAMDEALRKELIDNKKEIICYLNAKNKSNSSIVPGLRPEHIPLSLFQEQIWILEHMEGINSTYNMMKALHIKGDINLVALDHSIAKIMERHEILRTVFPSVNGVPIQEIRENRKYRFHLIDLSNTVEDQNKVLYESINQESFTCFNIKEDTLFKTILYKLKTDEYVFLLVMHHIISDGWSLNIFFQELGQIYNAFVTEQEVFLAEQSIQFADYSIWQREVFTKEYMESNIDYWREKLKDAPPLLDLYTDKVRPQRQTFQGKTSYFNISNEVLQKINEINRNTGTSMFMILLTSYYILLHYYSNQSDIVVGTPLGNRQQKETESLIGYFVNTIALRLKIDKTATFLDLLKYMKKTVLEAFEHQDVPFEKIVDVIKPERSLSYSPIFQVMFSMQNMPDRILDLSGTVIEEIVIDNPTSKLDLSLSISQKKSGLICAFEYNTDLFEVDTIRCMSEQYKSIVERFVDNQDCVISQFNLLEKSEDKEMPWRVNGIGETYDNNRCLHQLIEEQVEKHPDKVAVVCGDNQLTYKQLEGKSNQVAHSLRELGVKAETFVGIYAERSIYTIIGMIGIIKAGGIYVPIDPDYPKERISFILQDAGISIMLAQQELAGAYEKVDVKTIYLDCELSACTDKVDNIVTSDNGLYAIYTSGSTGKPKGVLVTHHNLLALLYGFEKVAPSPNVLTGTSLCSFGFDVSVWEIFSNLCFGGTLHILTQKTYTDPKELVKYIGNNQITNMYIPPALLTYVVDVFEKENTKVPLKRMLVGVEPIKQEVMQRYRNLSEDMSIINGYGPTETTICATLYQFNQAGDSKRKVPIGKSISGYQVYLVDESGKQVPVGIPGEILIGGEGVARGYINQPELTKDKFIINPFDNIDSKKVYRTGDLGKYLADGNIEFIGRMDNQLKIRGYRVELDEIEAVLLQHITVKNAVVTVNGETDENKKIIAYFVSEEDIPYKELRNHVKKWLPVYMVPSNFIRLESIPLNTNGKVDKAKLPNPIEMEDIIVDITIISQIAKKLIEEVEKLFGVKGLSLSDNFFDIGGNSLQIIRLITQIEAIFGVTLSIGDFLQLQILNELSEKIELQIAENKGKKNTIDNSVYNNISSEVKVIAKELLQINNVEDDSDFFDLGGHSLLIIKFISKIESAFGITLSILDFIELPTMRSIAEKIMIQIPNAQNSEKKQKVSNKIASISRIREFPLSYSQEQLWFLEQYNEIGTTYSLYAVMDMKGNLNINAFEKSLNEVIKRHDILRTVFKNNNGTPVQLVYPYKPYEILIVDLEEYREENRLQQLHLLVDETVNQRFNLENGPLMKVVLYKLSEMEYVFLINMHHIICDGWSIGILYSEISKFYNSFLHNQQLNLPETSLQYTDYVCWHKEQLQDVTLTSGLDYWKKQLSGAPHILDLPTDKPRKHLQGFQGKTEYFAIGEELFKKVNQLSRISGVMPFMMLLTAFAVLLYKNSNQADMIIGTPVANRNNPDTEDIIGYFVNTIALRVNLKGSPTFNELLKEVRGMVLGAFEHQEIPLEMVVKELGVRRDLNKSPLFQVMFHLDNSLGSTLELSELTIRDWNLNNLTSKFDLTLSINEVGESYLGDFEYNTDLFELETIQRMGKEYYNILDWFVNNPESKITEY